MKTSAVDPLPAGYHTLQPVINVAAVDETFRRAVDAGARVLQAPQQQFYGQRVARVQDAWGNLWVIATQTELVSTAEMQRRFAALFEEQALGRGRTFNVQPAALLALARR